MFRFFPSLPICLALFALLSTTLPVAIADAGNAGPLDQPLTLPGEEVRNTAARLTPSVGARNNPIQSIAQLRTAVAQEQEALEQLPRDQLVARAGQGERGAQVMLASVFAREAALLSFVPAAANDAMSDAAHWYSRAASRGFPGAPSLDQAGVHFPPIRAQRERRL